MSFLFGSSAPQVQYKPQGFSSSGLSYSPGKGTTESSALSSSIGQLGATFGQQAQQLGGLAKTVAPGFSQFRQAGLADIQGGKESTLSNLRQNLAQRRILGSSFASDAQSRAAAEYDKQKADFEASSYLQELQASDQLIQQQYQAATQQFSVGINQMNFEAGIAANLTTSNNQINAQVATANANLQMQQQQLNMQAMMGLGKLAAAPFTGGMSLAIPTGGFGGGSGLSGTPWQG